MPPPEIEKPAPDFVLPCVSASDLQACTVSLGDYRGRWVFLLFYPRDFSFVCPTELTTFSARLDEFHRRNCDVLGVSVDTIELHREWLTTPPEDGGLGPLRFPLASDTLAEAARAYGVWNEKKGVFLRGLFAIDPEGTLQYSVVHNLSVGRSAKEALRVLEALQSSGLCPADWTSADGTIDPERALQPGRILGRYRIRERLGAGTFGTVYAAWDLRLERMVALKVLKLSLFESREAILTEARAAARVNHPHICTVYSVDEEDGLPVISMEYLDGRPLSAAIAEGLDGALAARLARQIASGLAAAHANDVVHGDLKPANIMVTGSSEARVLDFGLASSRLSEEAEEAAAPSPNGSVESEETALVSGKTATLIVADSTPEAGTDSPGRSRLIRGTPAYMSPEQATGRHPTAASDVFSFGLTLFEMLTGRRALSGESVMEVIQRLQADEIGPEIVQELDAPYRELLAGTLAREPGKRPDMATVLERLEGPRR